MHRSVARLLLAALALSVVVGRVSGQGKDDIDPEPKRPSPFDLRVGKARERARDRNGGSVAAEKAVADGLRWLVLHQADDGHWGLNNFNRHAREKPLPEGKAGKDDSTPQTTRNNDTAGTAFGLLPLLAAGHTHKAPKEKKALDYSKSVDAGLNWLVKKQSNQGNDRGYLGGDMYSHALATIALCEAYGMTGDAALKGPAQLAIDYLLRAQDPRGGGWRYTPRTAGDLSVSGFVIEALVAGRMAGLKVPAASLEKARKFVASCEATWKDGYSYIPGAGATPAMTAKGALSRQLLGAARDDAGLRGDVNSIKKTPPTRSSNTYYHHHATRVMFNQGGESWKEWNLGPKGDGKGGMRDALVKSQDDGAKLKGNKGSWAGDNHVGGRLGATSFNLLTLQVYWRYPSANPPREKK